MMKTISTRQILISLGATFLISSVSNAFTADQHIEMIKSRCSSFRDSTEQWGCFHGDITILEQIRRREREQGIQDARRDRDRSRVQAQESSRSETESEPVAEPQAAAKPVLISAKKPVAKPVAAPVAVAPVATAPVEQAVPSVGDQPISDEAAPKALVTGSWKDGITQRQSKNVIDLTSKAPEVMVAPVTPVAPVVTNPIPGTLVETSDSPANIGEIRYNTIEANLEAQKFLEAATAQSAKPKIINEAKVANGAQVADGKIAKKAVTAATVPAGKICHSGQDGQSYHCHDSIADLEKPKRDKKAEEIAAKAAEAKNKSGDSCSKWKSPMRGSHRISDCLGSSRMKRDRNGNVVSNRRHAGVDLGNGQQPNTGIFAAGSGKIIQAGWSKGYGCVIQIQHDECPGPIQAYPNFASDKCVSFYAHLQQKGNACPMARQVGKQVTSCNQIGIMGGTGGNYAKHLHFEMRLKNQSGVRLNPLVALGKEIRGASNSPGACQSSDGWLAATSQGQKTHSVGGSSKLANARK